MRLVRDAAISEGELLISGRAVGPDGERWRPIAEDPGLHNAVEMLIPDIVDLTLFELLNAIDNRELPLAWRSQTGDTIDLEKLGKGEMAGSFMGSPSWRSQYSSKPFFDPSTDLHLDLEEDSDDQG